MDKTETLIIFRSFERLKIVKKTLPAVINETIANHARLMVIDTSEFNRDDKWEYLKSLNQNNEFFLILSSNMSTAHATNMCLQLGQELYAPEYICIIEDDHLMKPGSLKFLVDVTKHYYGKISPNGLRYGLFTLCSVHNQHLKEHTSEGHAYPSPENDVTQMGRANACFRCAPANHWNQVLRGLDSDEYLISNYQVSSINRRNYHKGFTSMLVADGHMCTFLDGPGRGASDKDGIRRWDPVYTASDPRSRYKK